MDEDRLRKLRHDLRSPLVVITGFAQLLGSDRGVTDEERRDYCERILRASQELEDLIDTSLSAE